MTPTAVGCKTVFVLRQLRRVCPTQFPVKVVKTFFLNLLDQHPPAPNAPTWTLPQAIGERAPRGAKRGPLSENALRGSLRARSEGPKWGARSRRSGNEVHPLSPLDVMPTRDPSGSLRRREDPARFLAASTLRRRGAPARLQHRSSRLTCSRPVPDIHAFCAGPTPTNNSSVSTETCAPLRTP